MALPVVAMVTYSMAFVTLLVTPPATNARVLDAQDAMRKLAEVVLPKLVALPAVAIVTKSMLASLPTPEASPLKNNPRVDDADPAVQTRCVNKVPKLVAFPVVAIVTKSIALLNTVPSPPANKPRVLLLHAPSASRPVTKEPKLVELPAEAKVIKYIATVFRPVAAVLPPPYSPRVEDEQPAIAPVATANCPKLTEFPVVEIVTYCMVFISTVVEPPAKTPTAAAGVTLPLGPPAGDGP
jgi:hypothetical protein